MYQYNNQLSFFYGPQMQSQMLLPLYIHLQNQHLQAQYLQSQWFQPLQFPISMKLNNEEQEISFKYIFFYRQAPIKQEDNPPLAEKQFQQPQSSQKAKIKSKISKKRRRNAKKFYNQGHWTSKEHRQYLSFILERKEVILQPDLKREQQVFKSMSMIIKTRTAAQCRSHHQKFDFMGYLNQECPTGDESK